MNDNNDVDLNREATSFDDAKHLIEQLRQEIRKRPRSIVIDPDSDADPFGVDQFQSRIKVAQTYRIEISDGRRVWTFAAVVAVGTPSEQAEYATYLTSEGRGAIVPTMVRPAPPPLSQ